MCPTTPDRANKAAAAAGSCDRSWREEAAAAGSLRQVDLDRGANGWASPPGDLFHLRARGYFSGGGGKRGKAPSAAEWLLRPAGVDWLRSHTRLDHVLARDDNRVAAAFRRARLRKDPTAHFLLAVNLQVPGRPDAYSAVFYFAAEAPIPPDSLLGRFIHGDDAYRNARFKIANRIVKGPWLVRATVGNYAACLLGRALTCRYHKGDDYLEIDVDIGSSAIARAILHLALGAVTSVTIDMGFLVESQSEEELPERLFGAVRIAQMEMSAAKYVELPPDAAMPETAGRAGAGFRVSSAKVVNHSRQQEHAGGKVGRSMSCPERDSGAPPFGFGGGAGPRGRFGGLGGGGGFGGGRQQRCLRLEFPRRHRDVVRGAYVDHVLAEAAALRLRMRERRLYTNGPGMFCGGGSGIDDHQMMWSSHPFKHPSTFDTLADDPALRDAIRDDLLRFVRRRDHYARAGRAWKRGYLLHGPPGTGKTSLVAAIANLLEFDIYDLELTAVGSNTDLRRLLASTRPKSLIVVEDIDCSLGLFDRTRTSSSPSQDAESDDPGTPRHVGMPPFPHHGRREKISLSGVLNFVDGLWSSCVGERLIVFTTNHVDRLDPALLRPGRMDRKVELGYCKGQALRVLARNYLGDDDREPADDCRYEELIGEAERLLEEVHLTPADVAEVFMGCDGDGAHAALQKLVDDLNNQSIAQKCAVSNDV